MAFSPRMSSEFFFHYIIWMKKSEENGDSFSMLGEIIVQYQNVLKF